ncbi:MAG TPA: radical SAM protein [Verrucomicrobiae bacterium]|jgi:DNA repair photolyase|nr:radical SAM protein [Verrucomicrobiae bacterium]
MITKIWNRPATIEPNNFKFKSLSNWSYNIAVGCEHACRFCYVPEVSTNRMAGKLETYGVTDPDAQWGEYVFPRTWDKSVFLNSLHKAQETPVDQLAPDGNRAVMLCTTTDPYQVLPKDMQAQRRTLVREALREILDGSTLNVRILTRSPLAREDFDLFKCFGKRLLFGMSIPTLDNRLAKIYEPKAPAPTQRLATLRAAKELGLHVFVAVAPVYPDCDMVDMSRTLKAVKELDPVTIFMEPINIRADNVKRIEAHAQSLGAKINTEVFATRELWKRYAQEQLGAFQSLAQVYHGIPDNVLHLWPDKSLATGHWDKSWFEIHWSKISAWPK